MLTTKVRQMILHIITNIMAVAAGVMDITKDKVECSISRILPVRHPPCRDNNKSSNDVPGLLIKVVLFS